MGWKNRGVAFCHASVLMLVVFGTVLLLLSRCKNGQGREASSPPTVEVVEVITKHVPVYSEWIASTDGLVNVTIRAQIQGYLTKQDYKEGHLVTGKFFLTDFVHDVMILLRTSDPGISRKSFSFNRLKLPHRIPIFNL